MHTFLSRRFSPFIAVTVADGMPLEVGVAIVGGKGVDDVRAVVVDAAAAVGLCKFSCNTVGSISTPTLTHVTKENC